MECISNKVDCNLNGICSLIALFAGVIAAVNFGESTELIGFWKIMSAVGMFAFITCFPSIIAILIGTAEYVGEKAAKKEPAILLEEAKMRLELEKVLIETEKIAEERRRLIDRHLREQIGGADQIVSLLDQSKNGKDVKRQSITVG